MEKATRKPLARRRRIACGIVAIAAGLLSLGCAELLLRVVCVYIADRLNGCNLADSARRGLFRDAVHLEKAGHAMWAKIIREDLERILPQLATSCGLGQ